MSDIRQVKSRVTKKILCSIILISTIAVIISSLIIIGLINRTYSQKIEEELRTEALLIGRGIELNGMDYLKNADHRDMRIIWIEKNGRVIFDSENKIEDGKDIAESDEVRKAFEDGSGITSTSYISLKRSAIHYALRLKNGTVIRITDVHSSFAAQLANVLKPLLLFLVLEVLISVFAANRISKRIVRPINEIDLDHPKLEGNYPELAPLVDKLGEQNGKINRQFEELRRSREQFSLITESMNEGIILADPKLNILACNSGALRLMESEGAGEGQSIYSLYNSEEFRKCIQDAVGGRHSECIISTQNGDREVIASPAKSIDMVNGVVVLIMDVTEKNQLETMRREFTSNVSHELKTPLTTIYGISDMLSNGIVKSEDVASFGENIRSESERLINLINDIVSLSKLDENSAPAQNEEIDLYEAAEEVLERLKLSAAEKNIQAQVAGEHLIYTGNPTVLSEVLYNLCDNGIKYNRDGGRLEVKLSHIPKKIFITVSDTGIGIPREHLDRIFERFYRVDKSRSRKIKGTGLGLSIVKHGVMYHGGTVKAESTPGKGTIFTVTLPVEGKKRK